MYLSWRYARSVKNAEYTNPLTVEETGGGGGNNIKNCLSFWVLISIELIDTVKSSVSVVYLYFFLF